VGNESGGKSDDDARIRSTGDPTKGRKRGIQSKSDGGVRETGGGEEDARADREGWQSGRAVAKREGTSREGGR